MEDDFGNLIDPAIGYARGSILKSAFEETVKMSWALDLIRRRVEIKGLGSIHSMVGHNEDILIKSSDIKKFGREIYGGNPFFIKELKSAALDFLGGDPEKHDVTFLNRGTAANIVGIMALAREGSNVISFTPPPGSHSSIKNGTKFSGALLYETFDLSEYERLLTELNNVSLVVITGVTIHLRAFPIETLEKAIELAKKRGIPVHIDDASGYLVRPTLLGGVKSLKLDIDLAIACTEKGGLMGPRAAILAGRKDLVSKAETNATLLGWEARPIVMISILNSIKQYNPLLPPLLEAKKFNDEMRNIAIPIFGRENLVPMVVGGINIPEQEVLKILMERAGLQRNEPVVVPVEAACAVGMALQEDYGYYTIASIGAPGCNFSLRLKANPAEAVKVKDPRKPVKALDKSFDRVSKIIDDKEAITHLLFGDYRMQT